MRRGDGDRPAEREAARDGLVTELQPEPRRERLRPDRGDHRRLPAGGAARQPGLPGPLPAGLDLQGRDRVGRPPPRTAGSPSSTFVDPGYCIAYGKRVNNFDTSSPFGRIDLATALQYSVNSVFCNIGKALGAKRILDQAKKFGFYERPPLETPDSERYPSGLYRNGELWYPERNSDVDAGRMAFGQERMLVTPLQMAMVAGGIGNAGIVMRPFVVEKLVSPKGLTVDRTRPERLDRAVGPVDARDVGDMMVRAVQSGTGTAAQIPGYRIGGKTGTAETGVAGRTRPGSSPSPGGPASAPRSRSRSCSRTSP